MTNAPPTTPLLVTLKDGERSCESCGVATPAALGPVIVVHSLGRAGDPPVPGSARDYPRVTLSRCPACAARRGVAVDIAASHRRLAGRYGSVLASRLRAALDAQVALRPSVPPILPRNEAQVVAMLDHLAPAGTFAQFASRYAPVTLRQARPTEASLRPWSHLTDATRDTLRAASAGFLAEKVAASQPPVVLPCPSGGCAYCGLASAAVPALLALRDGTRWVWTPSRTGHLCPPCQAATAWVGSVGPTAMERALRVHLGIRQHTPYPEPIEGLLAWSETGAPPSAEAWSHYR